MKTKWIACGLPAAALGLGAPVAQAEPGVSKTAIRIGQSAGVTGPVAGSVKEQIAGAQVLPEDGQRQRRRGRAAGSSW
ncbi:hypothetical protein ACU4GD_03455 [Cupriavidus basilensis]